MHKSPVLTQDEFAWLRDFLRSSAGFRFEEDKAYLAEFRLESVARREGFPSLSALLAHLASARRNGIHARVLEAMATHETSFFRDAHVFDGLRRRLLPALLESRRAERRLTLWSAACSSGQEPYSLAMLLHDDFEAALRGWQVRIVGSDLSEAMIERARAGLYGQLEVNRGLPASCLVRHFRKEGLDWRLRPELRERAEFQVRNLLDGWESLPSPDVVLLRNVLIYLAEDVRRALLRRLRDFLRPGGVLLLGAAESILGDEDGFDRADAAVPGAYRPRTA